ncbi:C2H2-type zinc finger transcription factor [Rhizophagus clarus]|uniref:C2H2-type zinc finger transcription factor n=2 Tax=Rhizophagus clarus TaxID=94130 RepID=A0A8H3LGG8_9GLOM|nr:C2H2-type zinc finger transcription factor [Rhizophagus clarus]
MMIQKEITETIRRRNPITQYQDDNDFQPTVFNSMNGKKRKKNSTISKKDKKQNVSVKKAKTTIYNDTSSSSLFTYKEEETDRDDIQSDDPERAELTSNLEDDVNTFFQTSSSRKLTETGNKDEAVKMNKTGPFLLSESNRKEIENSYKLMERENMWKLKSGRFVEEELYKLGLDMKFEHACHSFIVDVDDEAIKKHFNEDECREIYDASGPEVPQLSQDIIEYLAKFTDKRSLKEVRKTINEPDERFDAKYDKNVYHDLDYIRFALYALIREIDNDNFKDQKAFLISVVRGESASLANADRKNAQRIMPERRKMGHKGDFIIRRVGNGENDEYGIESSIKTPKVLKDMLLKLRNKVDDSVKLQTVGMIHSGLIMTILRLDNPFGYVCRIRRSESMQVPDDEKIFPDVLMLLAAVLNFKAIVKKTAETVQSKIVSVTETFLNAGMQRRFRNSCAIPKCIKTPKKSRMNEVILPKRPSKLRLQIDDSDVD